jgi:formate hydrogenlyase transcriptional activator
MTKGALIGCSPQFQSLLEEINIVAPLDSSVLIQGETGTGKEVVAHEIHRRSRRSNAPFVAINCAAIPAALLESELFGHEKGAFTGAVEQTVGKFLQAHGGTLFLDEIGELPIELQPKLLRVLQEQQFERIGSTRSTRVDVRVIAATNVHLSKIVGDKQFRADLYYRLNVFPIVLTPLRDRPEDIALLAEHFVRKYAEEMNKGKIAIPKGIMQILLQYRWPGNVRELQYFIERSVIMTKDSTLNPRLAELELMSSMASGHDPNMVSEWTTLSDAERAHIIAVLVQTNWVIGGPHGAAARLGLPRTTLISRMEKLGISRSSSVASNVREMPKYRAEQSDTGKTGDCLQD